MGNGAVKTTIMLMVLVVLSVLIGAQISDSMKDSMGAFVLIAFIVVSFGMLWMGTRSWQLLYFLPAFLTNVPIGPASAGLHGMPFEFAAAAAVLGYGLLLWVMGYIKFRWRGHLGLDFLVVCVILLFVRTYIRYPVSIYSLDPDAEYVGGKEYIWLLTTVLYYIALSSMSGTREETLRVIKLSFYALCLGQMLYIVYGAKNLLHFGIRDDQRYGFFNILGAATIFYVYCSAPIAKLLTSPRKLGMGLLALAGILLGGRREIMANVGEALIFASLLKKEILVFIVTGLLVYGGVFLLGEQHAWNNAPHAAQRVVSLFPGVNVPQSVKRGTEDSNQTRRMIWQLGMDPRTGFIKDYIWGDGFRASVAAINRGKIAAMRRTLDRSGWAIPRFAAAAGNWHNGWLTTVHRLGIVGLVLLNIVFVCGLVMLAQVSNAYKGRAEYPFYMALCLPFAQTALSYAWGTQTLLHYFASFQALGIIKVLYCIAREEGRLRPLFHREQYIPMTIRDIQSAA